jgi:hypothetical protein
MGRLVLLAVVEWVRLVPYGGSKLFDTVFANFPVSATIVA